MSWKQAATSFVTHLGDTRDWMTHPEKIVDALKAMPKEQQEFVINSMLERIPFPLKTMFAEKLKQKLNAV